MASQSTVFELANSNYIKLIFDINVAFSRRKFEASNQDAGDDEQIAFVRQWRAAKLLEIDAVGSGDRELAALAAQHSRKIWHRRISTRFKGNFPPLLA